MRTAVKALLAAVLVLLGGGVAHATWGASSTGTGNASTDALAAPSVGASTGVGATSGTVTWTAVSGWQGAATYTASVSAAGHTTRTCSAAASAGSCAVTGLDPSTAYAVSVAGALSTWTGPAGTGTLTTTAGGTPGFLLTPAAGPYVAGSAFTVTVQARLGTSNDTGYTGTKALSVSDANTAPDGTSASLVATSVVFGANGTGSASVKLFKAMTGNAFTLTDGTRSGSATVDVATGSATQLVWTSVTVPSGASKSATCLTTCTVSNTGNSKNVVASVSVTDASGNVVSGLGTGHTVTVAKTSTGSSGAFTSPTAGTSVTLTISATGPATSTASFTFNTASGTWTTDTLAAQTAGGTSYTAAGMTLNRT